MKKALLLPILLFATTLSATAQSEAQAKLLTEAYKQHSTKMLFEFFDQWAEEVQSNENEAPDPYVAEAHKVFSAFYQPLDDAGSEWGKDLYKKEPYFIVQGSLWEIKQAKEIPDSYKEFSTLTTLDSAVEFRPPVHFEGKKIVYLTKGYTELLNAFLGNVHTELGEQNIMQPAFPIEESEKRHKFFTQAALIFYGHWGGYWQYETYPKANIIIFNQNMDRAKVLFRFIYEGGETILEKQNGEWIVVESRFTWIE